MMPRNEEFIEEVKIPKEIDNTKNQAVFIGFDDNTNIILSNTLNNKYEFNSKTYLKLAQGLEHLLHFKSHLCVINLDFLNKESVKRIIEVINFTQVPTILISSSEANEKIFDLPLDHPFITSITKKTIHTDLLYEVTRLTTQSGLVLKVNHRLKKISLGKKPNTFYFLAMLLFCEPIIKILYMKITTGFSVDVVMRTILSMEGLVSNFEFWFMFPLAGVALISEKSWSFLVFVAVQMYCVFSYFFYVEFNWPYVADSPHISSSFMILLNSAVILYFLVPENRRPYWNKSQKLWRNTSRYATDLPVYFSTNNEKKYTTIENISETGAYFKTEENLSVGENTELQFILDGKVQTLNATVKRSQNSLNNIYGYGVEFEGIDEETKDALKTFIGSLNTKLQ